jgi:hypothetical protein
MKDTIRVKIDYQVIEEYNDILKQSAAIQEIISAALESGRQISKEGFNIQLTMLDCK